MATIPAIGADVLGSVVKAYDIRGLFPQQMDAAVARGLGAAFARFCDRPEVVVGRDMRLSSDELCAAFAEGAAMVGTDVVDIGLASTDLLYFASGHLDMPGAMITASHNPAQYNGIKLCGPAAVPIGSESGLGEIAALAGAGITSGDAAGHSDKVIHSDKITHRGKVTHRDLMEQFTAHVHSFVDVNVLAPLTVVADTANAMGGHVVPPVFADLPFELTLLHAELDGTFPNHPADPLQPENLVDLQAEVTATRADIGLAFDGDADRVFLVDEMAQPVSGSLTTALVAAGVLATEGPGPILHNLICSRSVPEVITEAGGTPVRTRVGHSYIKVAMARTGAAFGGEHSGHYYFARNFRADSGLIAAMIVLERLSLSEVPLSELLAPLDRYAASGEINLTVTDPAAKIDEVEQHYADFAATGSDESFTLDRLDGLTVEAAQWWFNLRASNTEPLLRLNVEADTAAVTERKVAEVTALLADTGSD